MANHKSAMKRTRQSEVRNLRNRSNKSKMKTVIKAIFTAIEEQSVEKAQEALRAAIPVIDRVAVDFLEDEFRGAVGGVEVGVELLQVLVGGGVALEGGPVAEVEYGAGVSGRVHLR